MEKKIAIIDYGLGNIFSVQQSFLKVIKDNKFNATVLTTNKLEDIKNSTHIVLPGQGAFNTCMKGLLNIPGMIGELSKNVVENKKPFLGICVGMQLLANISYENGKHKGLGWIQGQIKRLPGNNLKLPHMGWNEVQIINNKNSLFGSEKLNDYYFVHSYYFDCEHKKNIIGITNYGINFTSFVFKENIYGVQFHPEKSSTQGLDLIKNFLTL